jgi:superfamily I DNA/RNA helicase
LFIGDENQIKPINELSSIDFLKPILNYFEKDEKICHKIIGKIKIKKLILNNKIRYKYDSMGEIISELHSSIINKKFHEADSRLFNITYYSNEFDAIKIIQEYKDKDSVILSPVNNGILGTNHLQITMSKKISELQINDKVMCDDKENQFCNNGVTYKITKKQYLHSNNWKFELMELNNKVINVETNDQERLIHSLDVLSIHKSQGSTFSKVIIVIPENYSIDFDMFYTAITRARKSIIFIAEISFKLPN